MLGSSKPDSAWSRMPGSSGMYVVTDHVDDLYERVRTAGAAIVNPIADQDHGNREFSVADPEGNLWSFVHTGENRGRADVGRESVVA